MYVYIMLSTLYYALYITINFFQQPNCAKINRAARETNDTTEFGEETISYTDGENGVSASIREDSGWSAASPPLVVAQGGVANGCGEGGALELEMMVGGKDLLTADTLVHADHRSTMCKWLFLNYPS